MTVDDDNSIYVGGLPYDCSESQLRRSFDLYGSVVAVKIINDRAVGGKCYGFVTFTNPRSAVEAINEMDGRTIGGRVVRVNEVKTRGAGGRSNHGHDNFRHDERDMDWDKGRAKSRGRQVDRDKDRRCDHSREHDKGRRDRVYGHSHELEHATDQLQFRDEGQSRDMEDRERGHKRNHGWEWERERDDDLVASRDKKIDGDDRRGEKNIHPHTHRKDSSSSFDGQSREPSSESSDFYREANEQLLLLTRRREQVQKEKSDLEHKLEEKKQLVVNLQKRSMKLEDQLTSAKKLSSTRQMQLTKLYRSFQQVKEYAERLKGSEQELQDLVNSVSMEIDIDDDLGTTARLHANDV